MSKRMISSKDFEERLNIVSFPGCEGVFVGDVLHYALSGRESIKTGLKELICIFLKVLIISNYKVEVSGTGDNLTLFSNSYKGRNDHYKAFKDVTSIIDNKVSIECSKSRLSISGLKYATKIFTWNRLMRNQAFRFGERMCLCRNLLQAYKDYSLIQNELNRRNIAIKRLLVYCDVMPVDCFVSQMFKKRNCEVITFHHGAFQIANNAWAYRKSISDYFLADSEASCEDALEVGYRGHLLAVGSPFQFDRPEIKCCGPYKTDVIGIIMNSSADPIEDNRNMLILLQDYCRKNGKVLYIKYHPSDNANRYEDVIDKSIVKQQFFKDITIDGFLEMIDIAIVSTSTVIKTALSKNVPTLIFVRNGHDYNKFRGTDELKFSDLSGLEAKISAILDNYEDVMNRQNARLNVLGAIKDNYRNAYEKIGII